MERRPVAATIAFSMLAFVFASIVGVAIAILLIAALNGASSNELIVGGLALLVFAAFAASAIHRLVVSLAWPLLGVTAGFCGFIAWLGYALGGMD